MENRKHIAILVVASLFLQGLIYLYFDRVLLAPTSSYQVSAATDSVAGGQASYSRDRRYTAIINAGTVDIYSAPGKTPVRTIELRGKKVSFFRWLEDRDLALMAVHEDGRDTATVTLSQIRPLGGEHELSETVTKLPLGSKVTDVAYSTATNVIYMLVQTAANPDLFRVYRTDANRDVSRVYLNSNRVGKIAVLYDQDTLFYDNVAEGTITARHGDGSWEVMKLPPGKYRLIGVDGGNKVYVARLNNDGLAVAVYSGRVKGVFTQERVLQTPLDVRQVTMKEPAKPGK